jgi:hypothetical protein
MKFPDVVAAQVLRVRQGDVLWIRLAEGSVLENSDSLRDTIQQTLPVQSIVIVTDYNVIAQMEVISLEELLRFQAIIEKAVETKMAATSAVES